MGLFLHETTEITAPVRDRVSMLAAVSLIVAVTGFLNVIGFVVAPVLAHVALVRLALGRARGEKTRGRGLAIAALWISYSVLVAGALALLAILVAAYAALPTPHFF